VLLRFKCKAGRVADKVRVLIVSDSRDEREMYAQWLQLRGDCTLQAGSAADGMRLALELHPDVVVTDARLPGSMDGLALTATLKHDHTTSALPVVVLTGSGFAHDSQDARRAGCDRLLPKPCLPEKLAQSIDELLRSRQQPGASPRGRRDFRCRPQNGGGRPAEHCKGNRRANN
jgi:CheY-like chemotaxis protein